MDLRKVFDQTVRDLRREVNKKVLKVPEIEQKVLDATSNEPWGPHGTAMSEIAQATRNFNDYQMIMTILWKRLADTGRNWRHVYKGLTLFDFLVAHGADRVIDELRENIYQIQGLVDFQYVEPNGKDQGVNVRKKAQSLVSLLNDKEKIREVRQKASANRDKYQGYSSTGGIFKPSSYSSTGSRGFSDWDDDRNGHGRNGGDRFGSTYDDDRYGDEHSKESDRYRDDWRHADREDFNSDENDSRSPAPPSYESSQKKNTGAAQSMNKATSADDDDDFDPRASAPAPAPRAPVAPQVDFLGQLDFLSAPTPEVDPFASPELVSGPKTVNQSTASNLFDSDAFSSDFGAFTSASTVPTTTSKTDLFATDPFAQLNKPAPANDSVALNSFDAFETLSSQAPAPAAASFNAFETLSSQTPPPAAASSFVDTIAPPAAQTKQGFQTKSSVWADSLSSGLIDLNITAPKNNPSSEFGDWTGEQAFSSGFKPMGSGSGLGLAGASGLAPPPPPPTIDPFAFGTTTISTNATFSSMAPPTTSNPPTQNDPFAGLIK
ncbi:clathrin interactor EPSIN 1 [Selaginella moellendorffii]|nr:clathrin interactor EPSIN 1 [Selaginella moellendorffii]XP_024541197.1 clathrin interactor EPSIN 1 [Selaginella moellendorffii]|eukprot:XP_002961559.2 clathrin interactor EPSIN 1 [Selaginella moellendorffii]